MLKRIILTAAVIIMGVGIFAPATLGQNRCNTYKNSLRHLEERYGEKPVGRGLAVNGKVMVELIRSENGSWTILSTNTNGISCIMANGKNWTDLKIVLSGNGV